MAYIMRAEQAMLTQATVARSGIVSSAASIGLGMALGTASNVIFAEAAGFKLRSMQVDINNYVGSRINLAKQLQSKGISDVNSLINADIKAGYRDITDLTIEGMLLSVGGQFASWRDQLAGTSMLGNSYNGLIQSVGIDPFITRWVNWQTHPNIPSTNMAWYLYFIGKMTQSDWLMYLQYNGWDTSWDDHIADCNLSVISIDMLLDLKRRNAIDDNNYTYLLKRAKFDQKQIDFINALVEVRPEPYRLADQYAKGITPEKDMQDSFKWYGMSPSWANRFSEAQYQTPSLSILFDLKWRGLITDETFNLMLTRSAVHPAVKDTLINLADLIPPSQDIITMMVREAFEEANILSAPDIFAQWISKKGFSKYWADKYWTAHFMPMPLNLAYANVWRGFWNTDQLKELLRIADIHPRWHNDIVNVMYQPPSIRELGYGYDTGAYTQDDIVRYRSWGGLSPADATKSAQALVDYRLEAERNALRTAYLNITVDNGMTKDEFKAKLVELRTNPSAINLWLQRVDADIILKNAQASSTEPKTITRSDAQWLLKYRLRDETWFMATLKGLGYSDESTQAYLEQTLKQRTDLEAPAAATKPKDVSLSNLQDFFYAELLTEQQLSDRIVALGYIRTDADLMVQIIKNNKPVTAKQLTLAQIQNLYYEGAFDENVLLQRIIDLGYNEVDANDIAILTEINAPQPKASPTLTLGDINTLYKFAYFDETQVIAQYENRGYSHNDAILLAYIVTLTQQIPIFESQYSNAWISQEELKQSLMAIGAPYVTLGMPEQKVDQILTTIIKNNQASRVATEKNLTKAEIIKGVKGNVLTYSEGVGLLQNLGYSADEANYLLAINKIVSAGDPEGYWQMRQATELFKKSQGLTYVTIPDELIKLEAQWKTVKAQLDKAKAIPNNDVQIGQFAVALAQIEAQMNTIQSKLKIK